MEINRVKVEEVFQNYVDNYNNDDGKIKLKIDHTYRVSKICEEIAKRLGLNNEDIYLAYLTGLLHDIGRFEQIKRFNTFVDAKSVNHAKLGVEILFKENKIRDFIEDRSEDELIEKVIGNHNVYELPADLSDREMLFAKILRDADKIDIFRVNVVDPAIDVYGYSEKELKETVVSEEVLESFKRNETVPRRFEKTPADGVVSHIAFVFGIYFDESISIVKEQGYLLELSKFQSNNKVAEKQFEKVRELLEEYLIKRS